MIFNDKKTILDISVNIIGLGLLSLSLIVMYGWLINNTDLVHISRKYSPMQFNTAVCFFMVGASLLFIDKVKLASVVAALVILTISTLVSIEYLFNISVGIEDLFVPKTVAELPRFGRMAINTTLSFLLISIVLLLQNFNHPKTYNYFNLILSFIVFVIGLIAVFGYLINYTYAYYWGGLVSMAVHTAFGILFAGIALILLNFKSLIIKKSFNYFIPLSIIVCSIFILLWQIILHSNNQILIKSIQEKCELTQNELISILKNYESALSRMKERMIEAKNMPVHLIALDMKNYLTDLDALQSLSLVDTNKREIFLSKVRPHSKVNSALILNCAHNFKKGVFSSTLNENILCDVQEVLYKGKLSLLVSTIDLFNLFKAPFFIYHHQDIDSRLIVNNNVVIPFESKDEHNKRPVTTKSFQFENLHISVSISPTKSLILSSTNVSSYVILITMCVFLSLLVVAYRSTHALRLKDKKIRETAYQLQMLIDGIKDYSIVMLDINGKIISWNSTSTEIFGYSEKEVLGKSFAIFYTTIDIENCHQTAVTKTALSHGKHEEEGWRLRKDGNPFWASDNITPIYDAQKAHAGYIKITRNLNERKRAELKNHNLTQQLHAIVSSSHHSIIATDLEGKILIFNEAAEKILGYKAKEMINIKTPSVFHDKQEVIDYTNVLNEKFNLQIEPGFKTFVTALDYCDVDEREWTYIAKNGNRVPVSLSVSALRNVDNTIFGFLGIGIDITERRQMDQMKRDFISTVSHELRTPLTSIKGTIGLLESDKFVHLPPKALSILKTAKKNTDILIKLINNILDLDKMSSGMIEFQLEELDVNLLVHEAVELNQGYADEFSVRLVLSSSPVAPQIKGDHSKLLQVLTNLISNAIKFSHRHGSVKVCVATIDAKVKISVIDNGIGIPQEFHRKIFQKFSQVDSSSQRKYSGSGLGLSISKEIVQQLGGAIGFESNDHGTTFFIIFPQLDNEEWDDNTSMQK